MSSSDRGQWKKRPQQDGAGGGGGGSDKSKKRKYFSAGGNGGIPQGSRGILISCIGGKEQQASHEAARLLQEFYDAAMPKPAEAAAPAAGADISALIAQEVQAIKKPEKRLFNFIKTHVNGLLFLDMAKDVEGPGPSELVEALAKDVDATRQCKSRLCVRFTPIEYVVNATLEELKRLAAKIIPAAFPPLEEGSAPVTFAVQYEHRASVKLERMDVINAFVDNIPTPPYKVDLEKPDKTLIVQLIKSCAAISVVSNYWQLQKYNIRELCMSDEERAAKEVLKDEDRKKQQIKAAAKAAEAAATAAKAVLEAEAAPSAAAPAEEGKSAEVLGEATEAEAAPAQAEEPVAASEVVEKEAQDAPAAAETL